MLRGPAHPLSVGRSRRRRRGGGRRRDHDRLADLQFSIVLDVVESLQFFHAYFVHLRDGRKRLPFRYDMAVACLRWLGSLVRGWRGVSRQSSRPAEWRKLAARVLESAGRARRSSRFEGLRPGRGRAPQRYRQRKKRRKREGLRRLGRERGGGWQARGRAPAQGGAGRQRGHSLPFADLSSSLFACLSASKNPRFHGDRSRETATAPAHRTSRDPIPGTFLKRCARSIPTSPNAIASERVSDGTNRPGARPEFLWSVR